MSIKVSVCIPCGHDKQNFLKDILYDFVNQSRKPKEIVVFLKPTTKKSDFYNTLYNNMLETDLISFITDDKNSTMGYAKNRCVEKASGDIVCMADCDDRVHFNKLEYVEEFFNETDDAAALVHSWFDGSEHEAILNLRKEKINIKKLEMEECVVNKDDVGVKTLGKITRHPQDLHHAHCAFRREIFESIRFDESWDNFRADDSIFLKNFIEKKYKVYCTPERLMYFRT